MACGSRRALWLRHDAGLAHDIPGHPERPARIRALEARDERATAGSAARVSSAPAAARDVLSRVHPAEHVDFIEALCARGGGAIDVDTSAVPGTCEAALRAAGGAVALVDALLGGEARRRRDRAAAARAPRRARRGRWASASSTTSPWRRGARRRAHGLSRVLILDWDVHHGNGTNDIFHADPDVLFVSIHESPLYPGTGPASDVGAGAGEGFTVNLPVPGGSGDAPTRSLVEHVARAR